MSTPIRPYGLHPLAFAALVAAGISMSRVGQTIGSATASAGTHEKDGEFEGHDYCVCVDFHIADLSDAEVHAVCDKLAGAGFCPYFRKPGTDGWPCQDARHVHALWPAAPMKLICRNQVHSYLRDDNGLRGDAPYPFRPPTKSECDGVRTAFLAHNPADN